MVDYSSTDYLFNQINKMSNTAPLNLVNLRFDELTDMKPYPFDLPVSLSIISWMPSICNNKIKIN